MNNHVSGRRLASLLATAGALALSAASPSEAAALLPLDFSQLGVHFDGVGSLSGGGGDSRLLVDYPPAQQSDILDALFLPNAGASLQFLKVEIGGDAQSTEGTEMSHEHFRGDLNCSRGYEFWLLVEAKKRNPAIKTYGLSWGVPFWIGNGSYYSDDNIQYHLDWLYCMQDVHGVPIDYLGVWNERNYDADWIVRLRSALDSAGFLSTRISAADGGWGIVDDMASNPSLHAAVDVVGVHYPGTPPASAYALNKTLWASEMWDLAQVDDWQGAAFLSTNLHTHAQWGMSASIAWCLIYSWYANLNYGRITGTNSGAGHSLMTASEPWSGHYEQNPTLAAMAHWTQFAQPGWHFLRVGSGLGSLPSGGSYATLVNTHTPAAVLEFSLVVSTMQDASAPQTVAFSLAGVSAGRALPTALHAWLSTQAALFVQQADVPVGADGSFALTIPAGCMMSVTTTTGQGWLAPTAPIPPSAPFPFPYSEDFNSYPQQTTARYWSSMGGGWLAMPLSQEMADAKRKAFPLAPGPLRGEADSAYLQVVPANPGPNGWATSPNPCTVAGNPNTGASVASWTDYEVVGKGSIDASVDPSSNGNGGKVSVTNQQPCDASKASQQWQLLDGDLVAAPSRIASAAGGCLALLGADPDHSEAQRLGITSNCSAAPRFSMSAGTKQISYGGFSLDVWSQGTNPGQRVVAYPTESPPGANEQWAVKGAASGPVSIVATFDNLCLDLQVVTALESVFLWIAGRTQSFGWDFVPIAYIFSVFASPNSTAPGAWSLDAHTTVLASGATPGAVNPGEWHELALSFVGGTVTAKLDGAVLSTVTDSTTTFGNVAIGSGWHAAWWDDVVVQNVTA
jgi:hypothetical protein